MKDQDDEECCVDVLDEPCSKMLWVS